MTDYTVKDLVANKRVELVRFDHRDGAKVALWYRVVGTNFLFPVPLRDTQGADWLAEDSAMVFMKWIRARVDLYNLRDVAELDEALKDA